MNRKETAMASAVASVLADRRWQFASLVLVILIPLCYLFADLPAALFFHEYGGTPFYRIVDILTQAGEGHWYIVPPLILYVVFRKRHALYARAALFIFATATISGILVNLLKVIFGRFRPTLYFKEGLYGFDGFHTGHAMVSFPSGHSTTVIGAWLAFALIAPKYRLPFIGIGIMLALTRVMLTAHYISDVLAGGYLGATVTLFCYHLIYADTSKGSTP